MGLFRVAFFVVAVCIILSVSGVFATWNYSQGAPDPTQTDISINMTEFLFTPEDMPEKEVSLLQRLYDILNRKYHHEKFTDSRDYLINETIQMYWGGNIYAKPYVGSMDVKFEEQIDVLFGDVLYDSTLSFLLKNEDVTGDEFNEISLYSTSDPLDCVVEYDGTVCVFVSVFTPTLDSGNNITGYTLLCESMRGYCSEVYYDLYDQTPSFSTDEWRDDLGYYHYFDQCWYRIPDDAMSIDGTKPLRYDYASYNKAYEYLPDAWGTVIPYGRPLWQCMNEKLYGW